jgi:pimeloyl-ACP methyl ester carboxylesterase
MEWNSRGLNFRPATAPARVQQWIWRRKPGAVESELGQQIAQIGLQVPPEPPELRVVQLIVDDNVVYAATASRKIDPRIPSIMFIHGAGQDHSIWALPTRHFARHGRNVLAVDLPGHGRSGGAPLTSVTEMADWAVGVMEAAGLSQAALGGHSLGSLAALAATARHPNRVRALALVATAVPMRVAETLLQQARDDRHEAIEMLVSWGFTAAVPPDSESYKKAMRLMEQAAPGVLHADLQACNDYSEGLLHAAQVKCPARLILGEQDRLTPVRCASKLGETLPHAQTVILEGAGHALLVERPKDVLQQLENFL